jgi:hypothetical protein
VAFVYVLSLEPIGLFGVGRRQLSLCGDSGDADSGGGYLRFAQAPGVINLRVIPTSNDPTRHLRRSKAFTGQIQLMCA